MKAKFFSLLVLTTFLSLTTQAQNINLTISQSGKTMVNDAVILGCNQIDFFNDKTANWTKYDSNGEVKSVINGTYTISDHMTYIVYTFYCCNGFRATYLGYREDFDKLPNVWIHQVEDGGRWFRGGCK